MIVFAREEGTIIWSDNNATHKAGRVPVNEALIVLSEKTDWFAIARPSNISLDPQPNYPDYWVKRDDVLERIADMPDPEDPAWSDEITDEGLAVAIVTILKWLKQ